MKIVCLSMIKSFFYFFLYIFFSIGLSCNENISWWGMMHACNVLVTLEHKMVILFGRNLHLHLYFVCNGSCNYRPLVKSA